jgi:acetyl/propionyl-CoA carboxylase alpha subunit
VDSGVIPGTKVSARFDPLLVKIIVHGRDRADAIVRARCALAEMQISGVNTNAPLLMAILSDPAFVRGQIDTQYLDRFLADAPLSTVDAQRSRDLAGIMAALAARGLLPRPQAARAPRRSTRSHHAPVIL